MDYLSKALFVGVMMWPGAAIPLTAVLAAALYYAGEAEPRID
ncbi:hypothetical protein [Azospirillum sp. TSO5]|nr:hypothetical protein [Azospirillum sp. TSO5]